MSEQVEYTDGSALAARLLAEVVELRKALQAIAAKMPDLASTTTTTLTPVHTGPAFTQPPATASASREEHKTHSPEQQLAMIRSLAMRMPDVPRNTFPDTSLDDPVPAKVAGRWGRTMSYREYVLEVDCLSFSRWKVSQEQKANNGNANWQEWTSEYRKNAVFHLWLIQHRTHFGGPQ